MQQKVHFTHLRLNNLLSVIPLNIIVYCKIKRMSASHRTPNVSKTQLFRLFIPLDGIKHGDFDRPRPHQSPDTGSKTHRSDLGSHTRDEEDAIGNLGMSRKGLSRPTRGRNWRNRRTAKSPFGLLSPAREHVRTVRQLHKPTRGVGWRNSRKRIEDGSFKISSESGEL